MQEEKQVKVTFIRHGESEYNDKAQKLRKKLNIGATWEEYKSNPEFMAFKYSPEMMDCSLSQNGVEQCEQLAKKINASQFDLILVSPLFRTLKSCDVIFKGETSTKIKVDPIFSESLRCACDVSFQLFKAKKQFPHFDFSLVEGKEGTWYIQNQQSEKKQIYEEYLAKNNANSYEQRARGMNKYMQETHNFEDGADLIKRSRKIRERLIEYGKESEIKNIAVVSHFYTISYAMSEQFNEKNKPVPNIHIQNATPMQFVLKI